MVAQKAHDTRAERPPRPTQQQLAAAEGGRVSDVIEPGMAVLFCGVNPGLWSAAVGHHFAHPSNRFWKALYDAGFTARVLSPAEEDQLLALGLGVTNLVNRATRAANDLRADELRAGVQALERTVRRYEPAFVAVLGMTAFRVGFRRPKAVVGPQPDRLASSRLWLLPNPSGAQAHYQDAAMVDAFRRLRRAAGFSGARSAKRRLVSARVG